MKELLHIPTGNIIKWVSVTKSDYSYKDAYLSFGEIFDCNFESEIRDIASGKYSSEFYKRNGIPDNCPQAEYEIIDI